MMKLRKTIGKNNSMSSQPLEAIIGKGELHSDLVSEASEQPSSISRSRKAMIGQALDRHTISTSYHHQAYPTFLKSHGPFGFYDHCSKNGHGSSHKKAASMAKHRFQQELLRIKQIREQQKDDFENHKRNQDYMASQQMNLNTKNNQYNKFYIQCQMAETDNRKREFDFREKSFYKPHFGPEDTDYIVQFENERIKNQKRYLNKQLT